MRRIRSLLLSMLALLCLSACTGKESGAKAAAQIAEKYSGALLEARLEMTADYGERVYVFTAEYSGSAGEGKITILAPSNIAGVSARIEDGGAKLEYDGVELNTGRMTNGEVSPMNATTGLMAAWSERGGAQCSRETLGGTKCLRLESPLDDDTGQTTWFEESTLLPLRSEIISAGRAVLVITFANAAVR